VLLHGDFCAEWIEQLKKADVKKLGLHANAQQCTVEEFLDFTDGARELINRAESEGVTVEYYLHALSYLLPRSLFGEDETLFRADESGARVADYNCCASSAAALGIIEERAEKLARKLKQKSHRYHLWTDDDFGGDVKCNCHKCARLSAAEQNAAIYSAILRGIRRYDGQAKLSYLVYGEEEISFAPEGTFLEYAPFRRRHDLPLAAAENQKYLKRLERLLKIFCDEAEVLEYFLSYDYEGFLKSNARVKKDIETYALAGIEKICTFTVFPERDYVKEHGFGGLIAYADIED